MTSIAHALRLTPAQADAAYLAISLVAMSDGHVQASGRELVELVARELDVDAARARDAADPEPLAPAAKRWLAGVLALAAWIDGPPSPARRGMARRLAQGFGVGAPWLERPTLRWQALALRTALRHGSPRAARLLIAALDHSLGAASRIPLPGRRRSSSAASDA
jgi:hypothetical protein